MHADPFNARMLVKSLEQHGSPLILINEQDAHEFFNVLFSAIDEEVNMKNKITQGISVSEVLCNGSSPSSMSYSPFRGLLASQLCCLTCGHKVLLELPFLLFCFNLQLF